MSPRFITATFCATVLILAVACPASAETFWYRGNTHVHTINSDGDAAPDRVVRWYKENGYHFVVLTDHDFRTPVKGLNALYASEEKFLVLSGVEVTDRLGDRPVHLCGLGVKETVKPQGGKTVPETIDRNLKAIHEARGLAVLAHPNGVLSRALTAREIGASDGLRMFEICCADHLGGGERPGTEEIWDTVLSRGKRLFAVAVDDAHSFEPASREPGTAWIMVRAGSLSRNAILSAMDRGDFYATTGVELTSYDVDAEGVRIGLPDDDHGYRTFFIGANGKVLKSDETRTPGYRYTRREAYVRTRIERSDGAVAWTQPVYPSEILN